MLGFSLEQLDAKVLITGVGVWGSVGVGGKGVGGGVRLGVRVQGVWGLGFRV